MKQTLDDEFRVRHLVDAVREIDAYLKKVSLEEFLFILKKGSRQSTSLKLLEKRATAFRSC